MEEEETAWRYEGTLLLRIEHEHTPNNVIAILSYLCTSSFDNNHNQPLLGNDSIHDENMVRSARKDNMELPLYDFEIIDTASNNFSDENKLGEGGFGPVYEVKINY